MIFLKQIRLSDFLLMLCVCAVPGYVVAADIDVKGFVTTVDYHALKNVNVRVWRNKQIIASGITDRRGRYKIDVPKGLPITVITFDPPDSTRFGPGKVDNLSGEQDHKISIVIYNQNSLRNLLTKAINDQTVDIGVYTHQLQVLERVYFLERSRGVRAETLEKKYGNFIRGILPGSIPVPKSNDPVARALEKASDIERLYFEK